MAKLPEGVYFRGDKIWIRYTPRPGARQVRERTGLSKSMKGAVAMAAALRAKRIKESFERRYFPEKADDCSLATAVAEYLDTIDSKRETPEIKKRLARAVAFFGKDTLVSAIDQKRIRAWQREIETEKIRGGKTRATQTVIHFLVNLRSVFRYAVQRKMTFADPMEGYKLPDPQNHRDRIATDDEFTAIVAAAIEEKDPDLADAVVLARELGLRQEKIVSMDWERVDLDRRIYTVPPTPGGKPVPKRVPLSRLAMSVLERRGPKKSGLVFEDVRVRGRGVGTIGVQQAANLISNRFGRLVRKLGIKNLRFHDLRHTAFTELERAGIGLRTIKEISGH